MGGPGHGVQLDVPRLDRQRSSLGHGVAGVHDEVEDDLLELRGVGPRRAQALVGDRVQHDVLADQAAQQLV